MRYDRPFFLPGMSGEAEAGEEVKPPKSPQDGESSPAGLRGGVIMVVAAVAAALGLWIWLDGDSRAAHSAPDAARRLARDSEAYVVMDEVAPGPRAASQTSRAPEDSAETESASETPPAAQMPAETEPADIERQAQLIEALEQGQLYTTIGRHRVAASHYAKAVRLDPDNPSLRYKLALAYVRSGQTVCARREMAKLEQQDASLASLLGNLLP